MRAPGHHCRRAAFEHRDSRRHRLGITLSGRTRVASPGGWRNALLVAAAGFIAFRLLTEAVVVRAAGAAKGLTQPWLQWDANWYLRIAQVGYLPLSPTVGSNGKVYDATVFLPLYPLLVSLFSRVLGLTLASAGFLVSGLALLGALVGLYRLAEIDFGGRAAIFSVILLLIFPSSLFLGAPYPEALMLLLGVWSFVAARERRWWLAGVLAALAALAKIYLLILVAALLVEYWESHRRRRLKDVAAIVLPALIAVAAWMGYLGVLLHDPLRVVTAQRYWDRHLAAPWVALTDGFRNLLHVHFVGVIDLTSFALLVAATIYCWARVRRSYAVLLGLAVIIFSTTSALTSTNRFMIALFPIFIAGGHFVASRRWAQVAAAVVCVPTALVLLTRYSTGGWAG